ncbi:hypothetical protein [Leptobacterium sp. I13]|uniref:hypothetical protein n=1 Tax=Leptobacterium meishanense TaxID=3128904 RepID=UPI0030ED9E13
MGLFMNVKIKVYLLDTNFFIMDSDAQGQKFKKWLDILQQESWQLELIISGFAIYGLFMAKEPIQVKSLEVGMAGSVYAVFFWQGLFMSWYIVTANLIAHVILRGLWIGAIGLRYVSGDIDYEQLNYSSKFTRHLKKRIGSFDNYVATLEKYCSIIFAITFLLIFYLLGLIVIISAFVLIAEWLGDGNGQDFNYRSWIGVPLLVFIAIGSVITFIDFITQGWLKKKKWTTFFYYPVYWVFKYLTLSFLYRPMVYNFLDTKFGRRLSILIIPLYTIIGLLAGTSYSTSNYINEEERSSIYTANASNYDDLIDESTKYVDRVSIPSKIINNRYLNVFIEYGKSIEEDVFFFNEELKPEEDKKGIYSTIFSSGTIDDRTRRKLLGTYLKTIEDMYILKIDTIRFKPEFVITQNKKKQKGFETFLDMEGVSKGKHLLEVLRKDHFRDSVYHRTIVKVPFWYYPE